MDSKNAGELPQRKSVRLKDYDYAQAGAYFVTICSYNKECVFGRVAEDKVALSELGEIVRSCWRQIPEHFEHAILDKFVIMPNHVHGIILLKSQDEPSCRDTIHRVRNPRGESFGQPTAGTLPTIIRTFKAAATREARRQQVFSGDKLWQASFFERVIRNDEALDKAREYIVNNPLRWHLDRENPDH